MAKKKKEKSFSSFVNNPIDFTLLITILLLLSMGLVMVLSASSPSALSESGNSYAFNLCNFRNYSYVVYIKNRL